MKDERIFELSDSQKAELDRRLALLEAEPNRGSTWEEVKTRLLCDQSQLKKRGLAPRG